MANAPELAREKKTVTDRLRFWRKEIQQSQKREKAYRAEARDLVKIYEGEDDDIPYNILYSNTETLAPAVYSVPPRPDTRTRDRSENPVAMAAAGLVDSYLTIFADSGDPRYSSLDEAARVSVLQALVPGRGIIRLHYKASTEQDRSGAPLRVKDESVFPEPWDWDKVLFGYAKSWGAMPWVAFEHTFTREEAEAEFGAAKAEKLSYDRPKDEDGQPQTEAGDEAVPPTATVYEVWHKATRKVIHLELNGSDDILEEIDDPYKLEGFFPMPEPLQFFRRVSCFLPVPLYRLYKKQAVELNRITRRIDKLIEGMKVRGFYDANVEGILKLFESEDNTLIALQNVASLGQGAKAENCIWLVPIEKHITVLQQLLLQRQQIKQVIFEIMGIADIMRGQSQASETLGAQEIKNRWGTLRLKTAQSAVSTFLRSVYRIAAELAFSKLGPQSLRLATGSTLPPQSQLDILEKQAQAALQGGQQPSREMQEQMALPAFEECLVLLKSDLLRRYNVDIETNSTIDAEATEDKENLAEFLNALAQFLNGVAPLMESGILTGELLKVLLTAVTRRFKLGRDFDLAMKQLRPGGASQNPAAMQKAQAELAAAQKKVQAESEKVQKDQMKLERDKVAFQIQQAQADAQQAIGEAQRTVKDAKVKASLDMVLIKIQTATEKMRMAMAEEKAEAPEGEKETS